MLAVIAEGRAAALRAGVGRIAGLRAADSAAISAAQRRDNALAELERARPGAEQAGVAAQADEDALFDAIAAAMEALDQITKNIADRAHAVEQSSPTAAQHIEAVNALADQLGQPRHPTTAVDHVERVSRRFVDLGDFSRGAVIRTARNGDLAGIAKALSESYTHVVLARR